jgi:pilus assembly protein Flp/PilA
MHSILLRLLKKNSGATAIEYALIATLVSVAAVVAMTTIGTDLSATFNDVATKL